MTSPRPSTSLPWSNIRWLTAFMGLVLLILGQVQVAGYAFHVTSPTLLGTWLTNTLHLGIPDINNVIYGLPLLIVGILLLGISLRGLSFLPARSEEFKSEARPSFQFLKSLWPWLLAGLIIFGFLLLQLSRLVYRFYSPILWIIPILIFAVVLAIWDRRRGIDLSPHLTRSDLLWMLGLLITGLLIGTYRLQGWPDQLVGDEGNFWTVARDLAYRDFRPAIFGSGVYSFPILSSFFQAWILRLYGITLWGWRLASVLPGVLTVIPFYMFARDAFNKKIAVFSSIALITSPYFLAFSRLGYNNIQALFITALALYWLYAGLLRNSHFLTFLSGCAIGLGFYTYFGARGTVVIAPLFILLLWWTRKIHFRHVLTSLSILLAGFLLTTAPYFVYGLHQDAETMGFKTFESVFFNVFNGSQYYTDAQLFKYVPVIHLGGNDLFFNPSIYAVLFSQGLIRSLLAFQMPSLITEHFIAFPLAGSIGVIFYLCGLALVIKNIREPRHQLLLLWFLAFVVGFSALNTVPPRHTHMVALIPALALLIGLGVNASVEGFRYLLPKFKRVSTVAAIILLGCVSIGGLFDYFVHTPVKYQPQPDQIMSWAGLDSKGISFFYIYQDSSQKNFKPYIIEEFQKSIPFQTVSYADVLEGKQVFSPAQKTVIFYTPRLEIEIKPILEAQWGELLLQREFFSTDGVPVLSASLNTSFAFERDRPLPGTFLDVFRHWSFIITLIFLFLLLALVAFLPASLFTSLPARLAPFFNWIRQPISRDIKKENTEEIIRVPEETGVASPPPPAAGLPDWATKFLSEDKSSKKRFSLGQIRTMDSPSGKDVFIHLHLPSLRLPGSGLPAGLDITVPPMHFPNSLLLVAAVFLAFAAQIAISRHSYILGVCLYGLCGIGLYTWSRRNPKWLGLFTNQLRVAPRAEIIAAVLLFAVIAFTRFYDLNQRVYGLEADETKWTVQSWYSTILQVDKGDFATAHFKYLPVSFWVRSFFLRLFGLSFISARIESAFLSLLSAVFLYLLVRRLTLSPPMAWLSTALYSFSFVELSAAHQALHNTTVEIWMIAGLFLFILALQERKWWQFQLAGVVLALGMLTYETFFPSPLLAALFLIGFALYRLIKHKERLLPWIGHFAIFLWPLVLIFFAYIQKYIASQSYHFSFLNQAASNGSNFSGLVQFIFKNSRDLLLTFFDKVVWTDSLIYWDGPFLNPWLLVFVGIGFFYNLLNLRRPYFLFIPLWFLLNVLYAPILVGSVWPRVLYTALVPLVVWGAMGLWVFLAALRAWFDGLKLKHAMPLFAIVLIGILFMDIHIFTSSLLDPLDRQKRRELADLASQSASSVSMTLFPYAPNQNDSLYTEAHVLLFGIAGGRRVGLEAQKYYQTLPLDNVMPALYEDRRLNGLDMFFDKSATNTVEQRLSRLQTILRCYPTAILKTSGRFFDVYHFDSQTLIHPDCYQGPSPAVLAPAAGSTLAASSPLTLEWDSQGLQASSVAITVEKRIESNYWIEVEDSFTGPGWISSAEFVNGYNGSGFLFDNWNAGAARYSLPVEQSGKYRIWIRSYKRQKNDQFNYITIAGNTSPFAANTNTLNQWVWEDLGAYDLSAGLQPISLSRSYGEDPQYAVFIDTILLTSDLSDPPEKVSIWEKVVDTGEMNSSSSQFILPQGLPPGEYRWSVRLFDGTSLIDFDTALGVASPPATFILESR